MSEEKNVVITWSWLDVLSLFPDWSQQKCEEILNGIAKGLHDRSVEIGWEIMESLIAMEGH